MDRKSRTGTSRSSKTRSKYAKQRPRRQAATPCSGILETHPQGYGFLRQADAGFMRCDDDTFVSQSMITRFGLSRGAHVSGRNQNGKLADVELVDGSPPLETNLEQRPSFERLIPMNPRRWMRLEHDNGPLSMRILDLLTPIGFGQRVLISAAPRAGKTTLLQQLGRSVAVNHPEVKLIALLVDERPEEITEMVDELPAEVFSSSLDSDVSNHTRLSRLVIDRCQRLVELGHDVVLLVDSLTRMTRAFNRIPGPSRMLGPGGLSVDALEIPRALFAAARAFKDSDSSLTIIATALVGTDNRMDEVIHREFKGTGNTDIVLDQDLADASVWPALDLRRSATRRCERLHDSATHAAATALNRSLLTLPKSDGLRDLMEKLRQCGSNDRFVDLIHQSLEPQAQSQTV